MVIQHPRNSNAAPCAVKNVWWILEPLRVRTLIASFNMKKFEIIGYLLVFLILIAFLCSFIEGVFAVTNKIHAESRPVAMTVLNLDCMDYKNRYDLNQVTKCEKRKKEHLRRKQGAKLNSAILQSMKPRKKY